MRTSNLNMILETLASSRMFIFSLKILLLI